MDLLNLFVKLTVDDQASDSLDAISAKMIAKAQLMADGVKSAMSAAWNAIKGVIGGAYDAYSEYEQQKGGIETFFGDASETVIENAKKAYETAGMSANQYMTNVSTFAMSLIQSVKERRVGALEEATEEETAIQAAALDQQVADMQTAISDQTTAQSREHQRQRTAYSDMLTDQLSEYTKQLSSEVAKRREALAEELDALRDELAEEVEQRRKAQQTRIAEIQKQNAKEISERQKANAAILSDLQKANSQELSDRTKALSKELQAYQKSLQKEVEAFRSATDARIKEIDREYTEKLKLTDEEEYRRLKAIEEQIDALDAQTEAERKAEKEREQQRRIASLKDEINTALYVEDREKAEQELSDYLASIEQDNREAAREEQKKALREESKRVQDEYAARRQKIKDEEAKVVEDYREARGEELEALQESNAEKLEERREANSSAIEALREEQQARVTAVSEEQAAEIEALRESQGQQLEIVRDTYSQELTELQNSNAEIIKERQTKNSEELSELQEHVSKLTTERQRANRDALTDFTQSQQDQQEAMRRTLNDQLNDLREYVKQQKAILSGEDTGEYIETTYEDQAEAARLADMALIDMSDNANKMGTDLGSLQVAYQGFSKQNYTMLDNLKLGFGGTKSEMERLLATAENMKAKNGEMVDYSIESFADIVDAIHTVQTEYYISGMSAEEAAEAVRNGSLTQEEAYRLMGTTAKEGSTTVQGSFMQMQAAWDNFLIALGDPDGDVDAAMDSVMTSVETWLDNAVPVLSRIIDRMILLVKERGQEIAKTLWDSFYEAIPEDVRDDIGGLIDALKAIGDVFIAISPYIARFAGQIVGLMAFNAVTSTVTNAAGAFNAFKGILGMTIGAGGLGGVATAAGTAGAGMEALAGSAAGAAGAAGLGGMASAATGAATATEALGGAAGAAAGAEGVEALATAAETAGAGMEGLAGTAVEAAGETGLGATGTAAMTLGGVLATTLGATAMVVGPMAGIGMLLAGNEELVKSTLETADENDHNANATTAAWKRIETAVQESSNSVKLNHENMGQSADDLKAKFENLSTEEQTQVTNLAETTKTRGEETTAFFTGLSESINTFFADAAGALTKNVDTMNTEVTTKSTDIADKWNKKTGDMDRETILDKAAAAIKRNLDNIKSDVDVDTASMGSSWKTVYEGMETQTKDSANEIKVQTAGMMTAIKTETGKDPNVLKSNGKSIMGGFLDGLVDAWNNTVLPFLQGVGKEIQENKGPEEYDKTLLINAGHWIMGGLYNGLRSEFEGEVRPYVSGLGDEVQGYFDGSTIAYDGIDYEAMVDGAKSASNRLVNAFAQAGEAISDRFRETFEVVTEDAYRAAEMVSGAFGAVQVTQLPAMTRQQPVVQQQQAPQQVTAILQLDHVQFGRLVYNLNQEQEQRVGVRLAGGFM